MKRISDIMNDGCVVVSTPGKQHILSCTMSNRRSLNESLIVDHDQIFEDFDFVNQSLMKLRRSTRNNNLETSNIITTTDNTWTSLADYIDAYGDFPIPDWLTAAIVYDVSNGLSQLHTNHIKHDAISMDNIYFMKEDAVFCILTNQTHARKIHADTLVESRADDYFQLGRVLFGCLTGQSPLFSTNGDLQIPPTPFKISNDGLNLARKMMARRFMETSNFINNHSFIQNAKKMNTPRFLKLI